jgi:hypothetical protein
MIGKNKERGKGKEGKLGGDELDGDEHTHLTTLASKTNVTDWYHYSFIRTRCQDELVLCYVL